MTIYDHIAENKRKTIGIILLFPLALLAIIYLTVWVILAFSSNPQSQTAVDPLVATNGILMTWGPLITIVALGWMAVSWYSGDSMMISASGAQPVYKSNNPEIFNLVENIAITAGMPMPAIYIIHDESANAFATGRDPEHSTIVLTTGIIKRLDKPELEAVIAHEMAHIKGRDVRTMMLVITGIGALSLVGQLLMRAGARSRKNGGPIVIIGLVIWLYSLVFAPLIMYALSRTREFQADANAAILTRDPDALARALLKISEDSRVEALDSMSLMSAACIADASEQHGIMQAFSSMFDTHPPIKARVEALRNMQGKIL